ncbi:growth hormone-regulated TBC protein 1-like [Cimex lectularius]|uniref:Growth hormone-regulated TBC protein 1 n=1 Tax=Cimex lectularius TaxID=79782 RepID=A0A8I6S6Q8_CIMLE|nr:growth hormone-regulated TBC protein 1-like [Cimex lectularius]
MTASQFSKVDEYGFERPEDFDYAMYENFISQYLKILAKRSKKWSTIMASGKSLKKYSGLKADIRKGIPIEFRETVWMIVSGAYDEREACGSNYYVELLESFHNPTVAETIKTDLPRTFPDNIFFNVTNEHQQQLYRVLIAYGQHNPTVGYCQGMNYIAGLLLLVTKNEESTFWLLKVLLEKILPDYYGQTMEGLLTDIEVISELVRLRYPDVSAHMTKLGLPWPVVTTKWFVCLYCEVLPTETVLRIWDCLFNEGSKILFRVALSIIGIHRADILACDQFSDLSDCIKNITKGPTTLYCHKFMQAIFTIPGKLSSKALTKMRNNIAKSRHLKNKAD